MVCTLCTTDPDGSVYSDAPPHLVTSFPRQVWAKQSLNEFRHPQARLPPKLAPIALWQCSVARFLLMILRAGPRGDKVAHTHIHRHKFLTRLLAMQILSGFRHPRARLPPLPTPTGLWKRRAARILGVDPARREGGTDRAGCTHTENTSDAASNLKSWHPGVLLGRHQAHLPRSAEGEISCLAALCAG